MKDFNTLCKLVEELDPLEYTAIIAEKSVKILSAFKEVADTEESCDMLATFMIASVVADGKLDESEYLMMLPMLKLCFGDKVNYETAKAAVKAFRPESRELKEVVDYLVDVIGTVDEDLKDDIVILCMLVCAIDGKITLKEKKYIKQLIR